MSFRSHTSNWYTPHLTKSNRPATLSKPIDGRIRWESWARDPLQNVRTLATSPPGIAHIAHKIFHSYLLPSSQFVANVTKVIHFYVLHFYYFCISICLDLTIFALVSRCLIQHSAQRQQWENDSCHAGGGGGFCVPCILIYPRTAAAFVFRQIILISLSIWQNITEMTEIPNRTTNSKRKRTNTKLI